MVRFARIVLRDYPHHVTARGNRRKPIFFEDGDQGVYRHLLAGQCAKRGVEVWAYCLMPNHVHLVVVPRQEDGFAGAIGEAHRRYTNFINTRGGWPWHLFQARFGSVVMDGGHLIAAVRYVSLNPVRVRLVRRAQDWPWSSVRAHLAGDDDGLVMVTPVLDAVADFHALLEQDARDPYSFAAVRRSESTGRPLAAEDFVRDLERRLGRPIARRAPGPKPKPREHPALL
jgi:putative transposase